MGNKSSTVLFAVAAAVVMVSCSRDTLEIAVSRPEFDGATVAIPEGMVQAVENGANVDMKALEYPEPQVKPRVFDGTVTREEAEDDVRFLFDVLERGYSGYEHFGGKKAYDAAETAIMEALGTQRFPISQKTLMDLIARNLTFMPDGHAALGYETGFDHSREVRLVAETGTFLDESVEFDFDGKDYRLKNGLTRGIVASVNGEAPEKFIKPALALDGRLVYRLARKTFLSDPAFDGKANALRCVVTFQDGRDELEVAVRRVFSFKVFGETRFKESGLAGIKRVECRSLSEKSYPDPALERYAEYGARLKDEPAVVLDIRENGGGNDGYSYRFFQGLLDDDGFGLFEPCVRRTTPCSYRLIENRYRMRFEGAELDRAMEHYEDYKTSMRSGYSWRGDLSRGNIDSTRSTWKGTMFVFADGNVASSGESTIAMARMLEGGLVLGLPSAGAYMLGNIGMTEFPHSRIQAFLATNISYPVGFVGEAMGFEPDIWVPPLELDARFPLFVKRYGIEAIKRSVSIRSVGASSVKS